MSVDDMVKKVLANIELHVTRELDAYRRLGSFDSRFKSGNNFLPWQREMGCKTPIMSKSRVIHGYLFKVSLDSMLSRRS